MSIMHAVSPIRWCRSGLAAAVVCGSALLGHAQDTKPDIDQEMKAAFRAAFVYVPQPAQAEPVKVTPDVVLLRRLIVRNRWEAQGLNLAIARQNAVDDHFTLFHGGAIASADAGRVRSQVGTWYDKDPHDPATMPQASPGLNVAKFAW
jgi:hypothetical protein